jgi:ADP-dependent NAD(P)H-hydrate dehydratase
MAMAETTEVSSGLLRSWPLPAAGDSKKGRGTVLVAGGGRLSPGAVLLAGDGALRAGAGRVTLATGAASGAAIAVTMPESGIVQLRETATGHIAGSSIGAARAQLAAADAVLIGPGLDDIDETAVLLQRGLAMLGDETVLICDAFAIGALARDPDIGRPARGRMILTPNKEEAALLLGRDLEDLETDLREIANRYAAVVTCYGTIADNTEHLWKVTGAGPGLGTSGSGDVLAGVTAGLAARGAELPQAAVWATALHIGAGSRAAADFGQINYLAREMLPYIGHEMEALSGSG